MILTLLLTACNEETESIPPQISFMSDPGYLAHDTSLAVGGRVKVGVNALAGQGNITFFQVTFDNGSRQILLDSGLNDNVLQFNLEIIKSTSESELWTFKVMDRDRNKDSVSILISKAETISYGNIITYGEILLGAQENATTGSFFSFTKDQSYTLDEAFLNQEFIDLIYYFGDYDGTLSSPYESDAPLIFTGEHGIANWTVKNETLYDTTSLTPQLFDAAVNDSLLLAVYEPAAGKRKGKYLQPGMVLSFVSPAGKVGLINILEVSPGSDGLLRFSAKIQE